ncbi:MAG: DUF2937 family protein [Firmicutes bacterium]|nr:DUF2937 family protein [Bacillota bacterium]
MKKLYLYPLRFLEGLLERCLIVAGAVIFAQFPQYFAQYMQRLGGHLEEARRAVDQYAQAAAGNQVSLQEYINIHLISGNKIFVSTGKLIQGFVDRLNYLENAFNSLQAATPWNRLWVFVRRMDPQIARQTWENFTPGIPATLEALGYALAGILLAWGIYQGLKSFIKLIFRKRTPAQPVPGEAELPA